MKTINAQELATLTRNGKAVIEFYGIGCLNCQIMQPILKDLATAFPNINFYQVNITNEPELIKKYQINSLPTILLFRHGQFLTSIIGVKHPQTLKCIIDQYLNYA